MSASLIDSGDIDGPTHQADTLSRIAKALGEPATVFRDRTAPGGDLGDTCEMLRLWQGLERAADRRKVLAFTRSFTAQE